jgi:Tfp pilus assembly protein PilX
MMRSRRSQAPRGYALTVVLIFLILLFALWSTVYRSSSSLLRIETNRVLQQTRDQGTMNAMAQAVQLLQYSTPSDPSNPSRTQFTYGVTVTVPSTTGSCTSASYTVQFSPVPAQGPYRWQVQVSPGSYSVPLPNPGASPQWP